LLRAAALRWPNVKLIGVDPAEQMIAEAGRLTPTRWFKISPAEAIPLPYGTVDLVFQAACRSIIGPTSRKVFGKFPGCFVPEAGSVLRTTHGFGRSVSRKSKNRAELRAAF